MSDFLERISQLPPKRLALLALDLQEQIEAERRARTEPIAVVGMGCRFPGADSPEAYWRLLVEGVDAIREVPPGRWPTGPNTGNGSGVSAAELGGFLDGIDQFDPQVFGMVPREAARMGPQQRLLLEVVWEALERAGYAPDRLQGSLTGVFVGVATVDFFQLITALGPEAYDVHSLLGAAQSVTSGRVSYLLGLEGPSLAVDTACSSSLAAVHLAVQSLRAGECRMALAGGVNAILTPDWTRAMARAEMLAPDMRCKAFDAAANGYVRSEGCGVVVLKRLSDALADEDRIHAVIRGSAVNQDGRSNGLTAPNGPAQVAVIRAALANAGLQPSDVDYVETHGTGTPLGDPIEVQALGAALCADRTPDHPLILGAVKTNVGHLEAAAGIAGLIKLVLALEHAQVPQNLHQTTLNPYIPWDQLAVTVPKELTPWPTANRQRIGGVSSFGLSGTNAHVIVESAPPLERPESTVERPLQLLTLSARSEAALDEQARRLDQYLAHHPDVTLADVAHTANVGRAQFERRLAIIADSLEETRSGLRTFLDGAESARVRSSRGGVTRPGPVAFLFTGHGSQYLGMGRQLYETQPTFRRVLDRCDEVLQPLLGRSILSVIFSADQPEALAGMAYGQPALFAVEYALAQLWRSWGVEPSYVLGHSVGEYVAACVAGVFSLEDGLRLIAERGRLMDSLARDGDMAAVFAPEEQVVAAIAPYADEMGIAAVNAPQSIVISGRASRMDQVLSDLEAEGIEYRRLRIPIAAHSPLTAPMLDPFERAARSVRFSPPQIDLVSGMTGCLASEQEVTDAGYWRRHVRETVRFAAAVQTLYEQGCRLFVETGPSPVLLGMGQQSVPENEACWLASLKSGRQDWEQMLESLSSLYVHGIMVDWAGFERDYARRRLVLPTYPFQREHLWIETPAQNRHGRQLAARDQAEHPLLGRRMRSPVLDGVQFEATVGIDWLPFLDDHRIYSTASAPAPIYLEMALAAARQLMGPGAHAVEGLVVHEAFAFADDESRTVQMIVTPEGTDSFSFQIFSAGSGEASGSWQLHASGTISRGAESASMSVADGTLDAVRARCTQPVEPREVYDQFAQHGLEFGPSFRGQAALWRGEGEALGQIALPDSLTGDIGQYVIHPALLDACFHPLDAALPDNREPGVYLLIGLDRLRLFAPPGARLWSHVRRRTDDIPSTNTFVCDVRLFDESGRLVAEIEGFQLKAASREALLRATNQHGADWFYDVQWEAKALPTAESPTAGPWLILADDAGVGQHLAELLQARGQVCQLVSPAEASGPLDDGGWAVDPTDPQAFRRLLAEACPSGDRPARIVHLWGLGAATPDDLTDDVLNGEQAIGCGTALHLVQAIANDPRPGQTELWLVTDNVQVVGGQGQPVSVAQAPLWGFGRGVALEHPELWGGLVDLDAAAGPRQQAERLLHEILRSDGEDQVALRADGRFVPRLVRRDRPAPQPASLRSDGAYLITGGLGGLGLKIARSLAEQGARHLVLMGRQGLPDRSAWPSVDPTVPLFHRIAAVEEIERLGVAVTPVSADVGDRAQLAAVIAQFGVSLPPLRGIIHAATASGSEPVTDLSLDALYAMLRSKVNGTWLLHKLTQSLELDFFVLFSSTTGLWGAKNLAHYAAANAFLDAFAHYRHAAGLPALSINWGIWDEARNASAETLDIAARTGLQSLPSDQAIAVLGDVLCNRALRQIVVAAVDWDVFKPVYEARRPRPFLAQAERQRTAARPGAATPRRVADEHAELLAQLAAAAPSEHLELVLARVRAKAAAALGLGSAERLDPRQPLHEFGIDSLVAVQLRNRIRNDLKVTVPLGSIVIGPSALEMASMVLEQLATSPVESVAEKQDGGARDDAKPTENWTVQLDHLSEDDLDLLLAEMLASNETTS
jgi:acyl transferase domain-containing protein